MVQTRSLEKAIEASIAEGKLGAREHDIDVFLNENEPIGSSSSSKLHDSLYRIWTSPEVQEARPATKPNETEGNITPTSTASAEIVNVEKTEESMKSPDPRVVFLQALNRLGPCLINKDQLGVWWRELRSYAIDSTGHRLDLAEQSRGFVVGVLSGSFYEYGDSASGELFTNLACSYGRNVLELYLSGKLPEGSEGCPTKERIRSMKQTCRTLFGQFARKENKAAFTMMNEYFVKPEYRVDLLDLIVEYLSESQNSKLFRIYETPFFESLLTCLEKDLARPALQLGVTALSMIIVHICDKLVSTGLLFRIYALFGRACSWQPSRRASNGSSKHGNDGDGEDLEETHDEMHDGDDGGNDRENNEGAEVKPEPNAEPSAPWRVLEDESGTTEGAEVIEIVKVISLFTFLYGLFPINTLQFCRQCDEYLAKHNYRRRFTDFWSRFMVTRSAEGMVRQFRVDPLFIKSTEENELTSAISRFQEAGSSLAITSICTSRRVIEVAKGEEGNLSIIDDGNLQRLLNDHGQAFQMHPEGAAGYWHRELLLLRSELAFANFSRYMSEQRALRWQKRASGRLITEGRNEELTRQNRVLRAKAESLETEAQRAVHSARTIMRERSAYESKIVHRNREFRDKIKQLEQTIAELTQQHEAARMEVTHAETKSRENQDLLTKANEDLRALRSDLEVAANEKPLNPEGSGIKPAPDASSTLEHHTVTELENQISTMKFKLRQIQQETAASIQSLQSEVVAAQADAIAARAEAAKPKASEGSERSSISTKTLMSDKAAVINRLKGHNEELLRRCAALEHELRARKVHEEERLNELQVALMSSRPYMSHETPIENRFRGRGGAQGVPRRT